MTFTRFTKNLILIVGVLAMPTTLFAHASRVFHYNDMARILNGFGTADYNDAMDCVKQVAANDFSPIVAKSTVETKKAFAGFAELFNQVSSKMDSMPMEFEIKFGLKRGTLSHPTVHRLLCHGWSLDSDPPEHILALIQKKTGVDKVDILNFWRQYQFETFMMAEKHTGLPAVKAKAFAGLMWDIHLLGDWTPDNMEVSKLVPVKSLSEDFCKNLRILIGDKAESICEKITEFVNSRIAKGMPTRHITLEFMECLPKQKLGTEIYIANKGCLKRIWNIDVAVNVNEANATIRVQGDIAAIAKEKEIMHLAKEAKLKNKSFFRKSPEVVKLTEDAELKVVQDIKCQCKNATIKRGVLSKSLKPQKGYLVPITYKSGIKGHVLIMKSSAVKIGMEEGVKTATTFGAPLVSGIGAGAAEGVCAFVISSGIAFTMYQYGAIDDEELKEEFAQAAISAAVVGTVVAVTVVLGANPYGPVVIAIGIGGYVLCDIALELMKGQPFTCDDILGYMDEEFEDTVSFFTIGTKQNDTFVDKKGKDSFVDVPEVPTFIDFGSKGKSFTDLLD